MFGQTRLTTTFLRSKFKLTVFDSLLGARNTRVFSRDRETELNLFLSVGVIHSDEFKSLTLAADMMY